jgi:hypothetical protein
MVEASGEGGVLMVFIRGSNQINSLSNSLLHKRNYATFRSCLDAVHDSSGAGPAISKLQRRSFICNQYT